MIGSYDGLKYMESRNNQTVKMSDNVKIGNFTYENKETVMR